MEAAFLKLDPALSSSTTTTPASRDRLNLRRASVNVYQGEGIEIEDDAFLSNENFNDSDIKEQQELAALASRMDQEGSIALPRTPLSMAA